jgi:hypothetical protein
LPKPITAIKDTVTANTKPVQKPERKNRPGQLSTDTVTAKNSNIKNDSLIVAIKDTIDKRPELKLRTKEETDTIRFITAFRNVRIYNDSLQAVADSMFYSGIDSAFQLYYDPVAWAKGSQVTGDTILLYTKNKKPARLFVYENALLIQSVKEKAEFYNQIKGRTINAYFKSGEIDFVKAKGTAESIYYAQDSDSAFIGMNRTTADMIDMFFENKEAKKVKFTSSVKGTTYPIRKLPADQKKLDSFKWLEKRRPKNKLELFL